MKKFIYTSAIFGLVEIVLLVILHIFYIRQFYYLDYIEELYKKFGLDYGEEDVDGNYITWAFEKVFEPNGLGALWYSFLSFLCLFFVFIFIFPFTITYLCHIRRKGCCKCKICYGYFTLIFSMVLSAAYIYYASVAKYKIDLSDDEIYRFDDNFNKKTRKNLKFMKIRRIILIVGVCLLYVAYIAHFLLLLLNNKKIIIEQKGTILQNNNVITENNMVNQVQIITTNENRISENK